MNLGPIVLTVPSHPAMARVARLTAGAVMAVADTSIDDLDDIKILVSEVVGALTDHGDGGDIVLRFEIVDDVAHIDGSVDADALDLGSPDLELCRTVLQAIAETHQLELTCGRLVVTASKPLDLTER